MTLSLRMRVVEAGALRFCPCGFSWKQGDLSDPMKWHREVGIHQARLDRQRLEWLERTAEAESGRSR